MRRRNPQCAASFIHNLCLQGINTQDIQTKNISSRDHSPPHMASSNIIKNHDFSSSELPPWHATSGHGYVASQDSSNYLPGVSPAATTSSNGNYAVVTQRTEKWQGLEQDITNSVSEDDQYTFSAWVRVHGESLGAEVIATVRLEQNSERDYKFVGRAYALTNDWVNLVGSFKLETKPDSVVIYLEGPEAGVDLLVDSVVVSPLSPSSVAATQGESSNAYLFTAEDKKIINNTHFEDDIQSWSGNGCDILSHYSLGHETILPFSGQCFASATERTASWNGIQQDITGRVQRNVAYEVTAVVRVSGRNVTSGDVEATLLLKSPDQQDQYISIAKVKASSEHWVHLQGKFLISDFPSEVFIYLEGPPPGTDILVDSLLVKCAVKLPPSPQPVIEGFADYGVNIIENSDLNDGCKGWISLGECKLRVCEGSPPIPNDFLGSHEPSSGHYLCATERTETWMGPAQKITDKLKLFLTYQVSALVSVSSGVTHPQTVKITLVIETPCETSTGVDKHWEDVGQVEVGNDEWHEIRGSFRIEKQPSEVMVFVQGPSSGVDIMVDRLQIFPVDRNARFEKLKRQTEQIRKRDVILKFSGSNFSGLVGSPVRVEQTKNSFPFGSCISRKNIDKEEFVNFFIENFNWAVFENELKWYWTERKQSECDYDHADDLLAFCKKHNIDIRGHCIFWEVDDGENSSVPLWVSSLNETELKEAVKNRLTDLLPRYEGKFKHYDVNNEMLHGSFYQDRLGEDIRSYMFKKANQLDPSATLFVNDYNVEDGRDSLSSPEKYIQHIRDLQEQGAPVGGIGIQGHIKCPVGEIVCSAFDKLKVLDLPIWLTELDVSSTNEYVRADDLEVMLREAFAHPAVHGIMLWGFMELGMSRENAHLVDADGTPNAAGERYISLKKEWLSEANGCINSEGEFSFRGFHGAYTVEIDGYISKTFVIDKGNSKQVVTINL